MSHGRFCILVDDIVDSAGTLCNAAAALLEAGAEEVVAYITHGVLSGGAVARVEGSVLSELVITDSIGAHAGGRRRQEDPPADDRAAARRGDQAASPTKARSPACSTERAERSWRAPSLSRFHIRCPQRTPGDERKGALPILLDACRAAARFRPSGRRTASLRFTSRQRPAGHRPCAFPGACRADRDRVAADAGRHGRHDRHEGAGCGGADARHRAGIGTLNAPQSGSGVANGS